MVLESGWSLRLGWLVALVAMLAIAFVASGSRAEAGGPDMGSLENAGYTCLDIAGGMHCFKNLPAGQTAVPVMVFNYDGEFEGTELLIASDLYAGQPCPQQELEEYLDLGALGYRACHHYYR